jgi:hypothetical protein
MILKLSVAGKLVSCLMTYTANSRCSPKPKMRLPEPAPLSVDELFKVERVIAYTELHKDKAFFSISENLTNGCTLESQNAFLTRKKYYVSLPFDPSVSPSPQRASSALMSPAEIKICQEEISNLLQKGLIEPSKSPWGCRSFYVNNHFEIKRCKPRLVVNYKPLNKVLQPLKYPFPNKSSLLQKIRVNVLFGKFDLKSGFYQIGIVPEDKFKTAFIIPHCQY